MKTSTCTILAAFLSIGFSFAEDQPKIEKNAAPKLENSIQPRSPGATWHYRSTHFEGGKVNRTGTGHEKVVASIKLDGVDCFRIESHWDDRSPVAKLAGLGGDLVFTYHYWEYVDAKGVHEFEEDEDNPKPPTSLADFKLTLKYPAEKGDRYIVDGDPYEVIATEEKIKVAAGEFSCIVYQAVFIDKEDPEFSSRDRIFMSPGVGLIRWESDEKNDKGEWVLGMRENLTKYSMKLGKDDDQKEKESDAEKTE